MARNFRSQDIDEYRECFYLNARHGTIKSLDELSLIMRSLGLSPTINEMKVYLKEKGMKLTFADFLEVLATHVKKEKVPDEILDAFKANDPKNKGVIKASELKHILGSWGEKLSQKEVEHIFREANITGGNVKYADFVKIVSSPVPDYY